MDGLEARIGPSRIHSDVRRARLKNRCNHSSVPWSWKTYPSSPRASSSGTCQTVTWISCRTCSDMWMLWITMTLTKNQKSRGSRIRRDRDALGSAGVPPPWATQDPPPPPPPPSRRPHGHPLDYRGSHAAVPSVKLSGSPCELMTEPTAKSNSPGPNVTLATNPLFSFAGPLPEFEKWSVIKPVKTSGLASEFETRDSLL